jgi:stage II sporulation protein P
MRRLSPLTIRIYRNRRRGKHKSNRLRYIVFMALFISLLFGWFFVVQAQSTSSHLNLDEKTFQEKPNMLENKNLLEKSLAWIMGIDFNNPRSLLLRQIPSLAIMAEIEDDAELAYDDGRGRYVDPPVESQPPLEWILEENGKKVATLAGQALNQNKAKAAEKALVLLKKEDMRKEVFIYHTHNRESYLPWLKGVTKPERAYDVQQNITLVGQRLAEELESRGVGALVSTTDYAKIIPTFSKSYAYSLKTLKTALAENKDIQYVFDLHRDSQPKEKTTITIDGKPYAQIYIIIGKQNPSWKKNYELGVRFHKKVEELYPGLSKSVYTKMSGNGEYNQAAFGQSILIEVGGVENTKEEVFRTTEAMAEAIAALIHETRSVPVNAASNQTEKKGENE